MAVVLLGGCQRPDPTTAPFPTNTDGSADGRTERAEPTSPGALRGDGPPDDDATGAALLAAVPEDAWFAGALTGIDGVHEARFLEALVPVGDARLLIGLEPGRRSSTVTTWRLTEGRPVRPAAPMDRLEVPHASNPLIGPRVVPIPGRGALLLKTTDSLGVEGMSASFVARAITGDADIPEHGDPVEVDGWVVRGPWSATRLGDDALVCFVGAPGQVPLAGEGADRFAAEARAPETRTIACGVLSMDAEWVRPPVGALPARAADAPAPVALVGGGESSAVLLTTSEDGTRIVAHTIRDGATLEVSEPATVAALNEPATGEFVFPNAPVGVATDDGHAIAMQGDAAVPTVAAIVAPDGTTTATQGLLPFASMLERPRMVTGAERTGLLLDSAGRDGARSVLAYIDGRASIIDFPALLDPTREALRALRLGPADGPLVTVVWEHPMPRRVGLAIYGAPGF